MEVATENNSEKATFFSPIKTEKDEEEEQLSEEKGDVTFLFESSKRNLDYFGFPGGSAVPEENYRKESTLESFMFDDPFYDFPVRKRAALNPYTTKCSELSLVNLHEVSLLNFCFYFLFY